MIHPDLYQEITRLSDLLRAKFSPSEFIPGCEVMSVADVSLYASNNGWIEAICGQHNQQRVRWKSAEAVTVGAFIDVIYFPDRRLFEAYGIGGAAAITSADIPKSIIDDKGDLIAGTADNTPAILPVSGNDGWVLTEDSGEATGLIWAAASGGGGSSDPNAFINGALQFWQRGTSFAAVASLTRVADGFKYSKIGTMVHTISQSTDVPTVAEADVLLPYSLLLDCTTAQAVIGSTDLCRIERVIEGSNFLNLAQREFTLSFWVKGTKTGIHCVALRNDGADRSYIAEYTINTTATWELKTITVPASPSAGTWNYTTGAGIQISWILAVGSDFHTTAGAWQTGNFFGTSSQVNACDNAANDLRITGIKIEPGAVATPFLLPDYAQELGRCQRYFWTFDTGYILPGFRQETQYIRARTVFPTVMRAIPTLSHNVSAWQTVAATGTGASAYNFNTSAYVTISGALTGPFITRPSTQASAIYLAAGTSFNGTAGAILELELGSSVVLGFSAEF